MESIAFRRPGEVAGLQGVTWRDAADAAIDQDGPGQLFDAFDLRRGPETPILSLLCARVKARRYAVAVQDDTRALTYAELMGEAAALSAAVAAAAPTGRPVGIRLRDTVSGPIALLACLAAATPAVLFDRADPLERFAALAAAGGIETIITEDDLPGFTCIRPTGHPAADLAPRPLAQGDAAFVVWTSGSTGLPKGIVHSQRSVLFRAGLLVNSGHLGPADRYLSLNTPASMGALLNALAAFLSGATLHRVEMASAGLGGILRRIRERRITAVIGVPALYRTLARLSGDGAALASLRLLSSNGEALLAADLALLRACLPADCRIQMVYGATETQAGMRFVPDHETPDTQVPAGRPIPGTQFAIVDDQGRPAAPGAAGELMIRSRYTAIGEWRDGGLVAGRLPRDPRGGDGEGEIWRRYAMGDLVRLNADGVLVVAGRTDRQLKLNGYRVEPVEVEAALRIDPDVRDVIVLPVAGAVGAELVAFVAADPADVATIQPRLQALLQARVPAHMRPRRLHYLDRLPLLASNKIDVATLRRIDAAAA